MYQSPSSNLESRFKAMSIERDNYIDGLYSRNSAHTSASPSWARRPSPPYPDWSSVNPGPFHRTPHRAPAAPLSSWRTRSQDRFAFGSAVGPVEPSSSCETRAQPYALRPETSRRPEERRAPRHHPHHSSFLGDDVSSCDEDNDDSCSASSDVDNKAHSSRRRRHRAASARKKRHSSSRAGSSSHRRRQEEPKYHDPSTHSRSGRRELEDDQDERDDGYGDTYPDASAHAIRYVGANNMPGPASTRARPARPSLERPASAASRAPPVDGALPTSPLGQSTLLKLVEQQQQQQQQQRVRGQTVPEASLWGTKDATSLSAPPPVSFPSPPFVLPSAASRPSQLLEAIVHNIAFYRRCAPPAFIPPEVSLAFDEYLARGTSLLKFTKSGPPHHRFFTVRFLDLSHTKRLFERTSRTYHDRVAQQSRPSCGLPEAVFAYYSSSHSKVIRRYFPLADLVQVIGNGDGHPFVQRLMTKNGVLKVGRSGPFSKYTRADYILQFKFRSNVSMSEETIAVQAPDPTIYLAWQVVADFFSRVGDSTVDN